MAAPFRVGLLPPSTCATTKPCGRRVIAATATPGLPIVVTTFTSGSNGLEVLLNGTLLEIDVGGDGTADLAIDVTGFTGTFDTGDFIF